MQCNVTVQFNGQGHWDKHPAVVANAVTCVTNELEQVQTKSQIGLTGRLRSSRTYPTVYARTSHFKNSFILHGLNKFQ